MASPGSPQPVLVHWLLDTRPWYPAAVQTADLSAQAARALALLPPAERAAVLRYVRPADAKMSLASRLLQRYVAARHVPGLRWADASPSRDARGKPVFAPPPGAPSVAFNVSHQAGLVALAGVVTAAGGGVEVEVGVDVVSQTERRTRDLAMLAADGWPAFVDMHADVLAAAEAARLKWAVLGGAGVLASPEAATDYKLRAFYALWCLREAYVKMTGEALLAEWLGALEFRGFGPPPPPVGGEGEGPAGGQGESREGMRQGEGVTTHDIWFQGEKVEDVNVCIRTLGDDYMVCTAVRTPGRKEVGLGIELGEFEFLDLEDILTFAESRL